MILQANQRRRSQQKRKPKHVLLKLRQKQKLKALLNTHPRNNLPSYMLFA